MCCSHLMYAYYGQHYRQQHTHTHPFNGPLSGTTRVSQYQKGKTKLDFSEARDSEWQWHWLDHMQVCTSLQTDNHASTPPLSFLQAGCPSCHPTNIVKALKAHFDIQSLKIWNIPVAVLPVTFNIFQSFSYVVQWVGWLLVVFCCVIL